MRKSNRHGKKSAAEGIRGSAKHWYFIRLAFLATPFKPNAQRGGRGRLLKHYYLVQASSIEAAFKMAEHMLSIVENCDGSGRLQGKKVSLQAVGVLDIEPLYQRLESGVEIFDESEVDVSYAAARKAVLSSIDRRRIIEYEAKHGKPRLIDVYWGDDFDRNY